jgi:hypothetical protein
MRPALLPRSLAVGLVLVATALPSAFAEDGRYGFYRVVEGSADVLRDGGTEEAQPNLPLLTGDRLWTGRNARVEVVLPDGTVVRVGSETQLSFDDLAESSDAEAGGTLLHLERGELQLVTDDTAGVGAYPRIDAPSATVYLEGAGSYRIEAGAERTGIVVRRGNADVMTRGGSTRLQAGDQLFVDGDEAPAVATAGALSSLERWGTSLEEEYRRAGVDGRVDDRLAYSASSMEGHGNWVEVDDQQAWQPDVASDWSPYTDGRWADTPSGMTWVSHEPWGWVPYHYGSWNYANGWGWLWYPGRVYAPAWVYWYWGPSHVGWVPIGYYSNYYYGGWGWDYGFGFGVHGWAGGYVGYWDRWNFVDCGRVYDDNIGHHTRYANQLGVDEMPRGVLATDTRPLRNGVATRPNEAIRALTGDPSRGAGSDMPDLTSFVAREAGVGSDEVQRALPVDRSAGGVGVSGRGRDAGGAGNGGEAVGRGNGVADRGGAVAGEVGSPRAMTGNPVTSRPRGGEGDAGVATRDGSDGAAAGRGTGATGGVPQVRTRSGGPVGETVAARPSSPSRATPPAAGSGGAGVSRGSETQGGIRSSGVTSRPPARESGGAPVDRLAEVSGRTAPPERSSGAGAPQVRSRNGDDGSASSASPRQVTGTGARSGEPSGRATVPPRSTTGGNSPSVTLRSRPSTGGQVGANEPSSRSTSRAVPPVRRVVEGVRSSRPSGTSGSTSMPPSRSSTSTGPSSRSVPPSAGSRSGTAAPQTRSQGSYSAPPTSRGGSTSPPSRGGYTPPSTTRSPAAPSTTSRSGSAPPAGSRGSATTPSTPSRSSGSSGSSSGSVGSSRQASPSGGGRSSGGGSSSRGGSSRGSGGSGSSSRSRSGGGG